MAERPAEIPGGGMRRFLEDLRRMPDRRIRDRRGDEVSLEPVRRTEADRRHGDDRRFQVDRRLPLGEQFSLEDTILLEGMVAQPDNGVACPRCAANLLMGPPDVYGDAALREIHCTGCRRHAAVVVDSPPAA